MTTYDMIKKEGYDLGVKFVAERRWEIHEEKLAKDCQRLEEECRFLEEALQKAKEELLRAKDDHRFVVALQKEEKKKKKEGLLAEEKLLRWDNIILNLHALAKMQPAEIAVIVSTDVGYVEELILKNEQKEE